MSSETKTTAAILRQLNQPLELQELDIPELKPGQVLVEIAYSGVCHTQLLECRGHRGEDPWLPHCLGHEGSGKVLRIGPGVSKVKPGDLVILSWMRGSGLSQPGAVYSHQGENVNSGAITTFAKKSVIAEDRLSLLPEGFPPDQAALLGCAAATGLGAVFNTADARPGDSLAVFGVGGIGLMAVAAARISGCVPIVAIDVLPNKLDLAKAMGATHFIDASKQDVSQELKAIAPNGLDVAVESSGRPAVMRQALESVRQQGGKAVIVGNAHFGEDLSFNPGQLNQGKKLLGTWGGDNEPDRDFPRYCKMIMAGMLDLAPLISKVYSLSEINQALDDLESGQVARPLIDMSK